MARHLPAAACLILGCTVSCLAQTRPADASEQELRQEVRELRAEVAELRAQMNSNAPTTRPAVAADSADLMIRDADRHGELLDSEGITAGHERDRGFFIRSDDGNFFLHPWAFFQVRDATNYRENAKHGTESDTENGFELPRAKFILDGNVFSPDLTYQFIWATSDTTGSLVLQDAWARYHFAGTDLAARAGQIRDPFDHEQLLFATKSLTPERSIVNNVLANGDGIVKAASVEYGYDAPSPIRGALAFTGGERSMDTTFQDFSTNTQSWGAAGRVEWKLTGDWRDYQQFTSLADRENLLVLGAGADYTEAGDTGALMHVADVQLDTTSGLALYAAYLGRYTRHNGGAPGTNGGLLGTGATANTYDSTFRLMGAWLIDGRIEPFARYEYLHFDGFELPTTAAHTVINDFTVGMNWYLEGHRAKFTAGASWLPNGSPITNVMSDLFANHGGNEVIIQAQFQLII